MMIAWRLTKTGLGRAATDPGPVSVQWPSLHPVLLVKWFQSDNVAGLVLNFLHVRVFVAAEPAFISGLWPKYSA